jgi:hypothetical protein
MRRFRRAQQGWIGLVALLLAILIVAWLGKSALTSYGLTSTTKPAPGVPSSDPRERARAVEQTIIEKSRETARQVEEAQKQ